MFGSVRNPKAASLIRGVDLVGIDVTDDTSVNAAVQTIVQEAGPVQLLVNNEGTLITYPIDYHGGQQYPHLVRDGARPDSLSQTIAPLTPRR